MKNTFINAYKWLFGANKREAEYAWRHSSIERRKVVIECFTHNTKTSFMED